MNTHEALISAYVSLGYSVDDQGCCHGTSLRWLEASFLDEEPKFHKRLLKIAAYGKYLKTAIEAVKAKRGENLTKEDKYLLEIQAFMDHLYIFQAPFEQRSLFNSSLPILQEDIDKASTLGSSDTIEQLGGLTKVYSHPLIYNEQEIALYLDDLGQALEKHCPLHGKKIGILLSSHTHTSALIYTTGRGEWRYMDINEYPPESFSKESTPKLARNIVESFKEHESPYVAFASRVITVKKDPFINQLTEELSKLRTKHPVTSNLARRTEQVNLCYLASQQGDAQIVEETARYGANIEFTDKDGITPVMIAAMDGYDDVIDVLAKHKANLNVVNQPNGWTPIHYAISDRYTKVLTRLAQNNADLNVRAKNGFTPLLLAVINGNVEAVVELIKFGANVSVSLPWPIKDFKPKDALANKRFNFLVKQKLIVNDTIMLCPQDIAFIDGKDQIVTLFRHAQRINSLYQTVTAFEKDCENKQAQQVIAAAHGLVEFTNEYISTLYSAPHALELDEWNNRYTNGMQFLSAQSQEPHYLDSLNKINAQFKSLITARRPTMKDSPLKRKSLFSNDTPEAKRIKFTEHSLDGNMDLKTGFS
ncbi:ankyrin repeat domain-containing protein [Legionella rowbothamii]|uniref:ankyrin repeat domain-containing protein n=1 Tax=Legionella rowbothamii TaxID=96229 RepID=UPI001055311D|nr:ankyrin repeat domain-containing protein [Legionella rowbothamii]